MSWHPSDLVTDADLLAYEPTILTQFGTADWTEKRRKAVEDWLWPILRAQALPVERFRTRFAPTKVWGYTSSTYTDLTAAAANATTDDVTLAAVLAAPTDYLYVGSDARFRGLSVRLLDAVSSVTATVTLQVWTDRWRAVSVQDGTQATAGKPFSAGGALIWTVPDGWELRAVNGSDPLYWARLALSAAPTGATATQIAVIRRSVLCAPVALRTLALVFRAAPAAQDGPWREKADLYGQEAELALQRAVGLVGGEFDTVTEDDVVDADEAVQTTAEVQAEAGGGWTLERA